MVKVATGGTFFDFLESIFNVLVTMATGIGDFLGDMGEAFSLMTASVAVIPSAFGWLPSVLITLVGLILSVVVVFRVIGRG